MSRKPMTGMGMRKKPSLSEWAETPVRDSEVQAEEVVEEVAPEPVKTKPAKGRVKRKPTATKGKTKPNTTGQVERVGGKTRRKFTLYFDDLELAQRLDEDSFSQGRQKSKIVEEALAQYYSTR